MAIVLVQCSSIFAALMGMLVSALLMGMLVSSAMLPSKQASTSCMPSLVPAGTADVEKANPSVCSGRMSDGTHYPACSHDNR